MKKKSEDKGELIYRSNKNLSKMENVSKMGDIVKKKMNALM